MLSAIIVDLQNMAAAFRSAGQAALNDLQAGNVDSLWVMNFLDQCRGLIIYLDTVSSVAGLNAYATANIPNYAGTLTADIATLRAAAVSCIAWVTENFPKDTTNTYILAITLNADGSRTLRQFTPAQTTGLQTALQGLIAAVS